MTAAVASRSMVSWSSSRAAALKAKTSLDRHDPPQPIPAFKNRDPIRSSRPTPRATSVTSAPTSSQMLAISLIKLTLVARKAFAAYLVISFRVILSISRVCLASYA